MCVPGVFLIEEVINLKVGGATRQVNKSIFAWTENWSEFANPLFSVIFFRGKGAVTGMLKTGEKSLYVFDRDGQHYQVAPPCVLDFYIHESRQRSGFGKQLFEHMLRVSTPFTTLVVY